MIKSIKVFLPIFFLSCLTKFLAAGQDTSSLMSFNQDTQDTIKVDFDRGIELFNNDEPLGINLIFSMKNFIAGKNEQEYIAARLILCCENDTAAWDIRIRARGEFRRKFCSFPPILLNLKDIDKKPDILKSQKTIKLVTECHYAENYQDYVFREYLIYKMYNLLTSFSYRVRLVKLTITDEDRPDEVISSYGYLIENIDEIAQRNNAVVLNNQRILQKDVVPELMARLAVFQYMIGNFDWQTGNQHNIDAIKIPGRFLDRVLPLPHDFDFSGFVNTEYAIPRKSLGLQDVRQRRYLGECFLNDYLPEVLNEFISLQAPFQGIIRSFDLLNRKSRKDLLSYLYEFYSVLLDNRDDMIKKFEGECLLVLP
jgi:hypothetical protein